MSFDIGKLPEENISLLSVKRLYQTRKMFYNYLSSAFFRKLQLFFWYCNIELRLQLKYKSESTRLGTCTLFAIPLTWNI